MTINSDRYERARARVKRMREFYMHAAVYVFVNICLVIINLVTNPDSIWFYWPLMGWGIGLAAHAFSVFGPGQMLGADWEERKVREYMQEDL